MKIDNAMYRRFQFDSLDLWTRDGWNFYVYWDGDSWRIGYGMKAHSGTEYWTAWAAIDAVYEIVREMAE